MTAPATSAAPAKTPSLWEDFVDILYAPSSVFERRRNGRFGVVLLVYLALSTAIMLAARPIMQPIFDTMTSQAVAKMREQNPQLTEEQVRSARQMQERLTGGPVGAVFMTAGQAVMVLAVGFALFLVAKMFDSAASLGQAMMVAAYAFIPRLLGMIVGTVLLILQPPERLTSVAAMTVSPAHLVDAQAQPVLAALLMRFDVFVLWATVLLGIGIAVVGKIPRGRGLAAAFVVWLLATFAAAMQALSQSA